MVAEKVLTHLIYTNLADKVQRGQIAGGAGVLGRRDLNDRIADDIHLEKLA